MREIKFRGFDKRSKVMVQLIGVRDCYNHGWADYFYRSEEDNELQSCRAEKKGIELIQYTGLNDKNGVEIYEGDIVRFDGDLSVVRYDDETARFVLDDYGIRGCMMEYGWDESVGHFEVVDTNGFDYYYDLSDIEVIGNIYENPELLEGRE